MGSRPPPTFEAPDSTRTIPRGEAPITLRSRKIRVEVIRGPSAVLVAELPGTGARVGSGRDADLFLADPTVSRHHLTLRIESDSIRVTDNRSRNGTVLDGVRVIDAYARPDATLVLGGSTLRLRMLDQAIEVPLSARDRFGALLGRSVGMRQLFGLLELIAPTEMSVLIEGETGTGKELVAEGLHRASRRANGPFVVFDCSAVSPSLIEGELFGHRKGAFTDARADRPGRFEEADGGTLFLDEVGELPVELQPKLLRALERREVRRIGDDKVRRVDVRIVAATNRSLSVEIERGRFRDDLYHRLAEVVASVPPLRSRPEDIPLLVRHFAEELRGQQPELPPLPEGTAARFREMAWPGNVRELRSRVRLALLLRPEDTRPALPPAGAPCTLDGIPVRLEEPLHDGRERVKEVYERAYLALTLEKTGHNVTRTAELAGVGRRYVQRVMERYGMREGRGRNVPPPPSGKGEREGEP